MIFIKQQEIGSWNVSKYRTNRRPYVQKAFRNKFATFEHFKWLLHSFSTRIFTFECYIIITNVDGRWPREANVSQKRAAEIYCPFHFPVDVWNWNFDILLLVLILQIASFARTSLCLLYLCLRTLTSNWCLSSVISQQQSPCNFSNLWAVSYFVAWEF